jgi:hypothetical protein
MFNRDAIAAFFMYAFAAEILPLSFSLMADSWSIFWLGQIVVVLFAFACVGLTFGAKNRDED